MAVSNYQLWTSEPESIKARRKRLFQQMGLGSDRGLLRVTSGSFRAIDSSVTSSLSLSSSSDDDDDANSARQLVEEAGPASSFDRLLLESSVDAANTLANSSTGRPRSDGVSATIESVDCNHLDNATTNDNHTDKSPNSPFASSRRHSHRADDIRQSGTELLPDHPLCLDAECEDENELGDLFFKIKNLDNGKEFIVNEFSMDGLCKNMLREVETGRQLTIEEFEMTVGQSPIVQELMRREIVESAGKEGCVESTNSSKSGLKPKKKGGWLKSIKVVANTVTGHGYKDRRSCDGKDPALDQGGRRSSSATGGRQDLTCPPPERTKVRQYGKSYKELTALYMTQEIQGHQGSIWCIKFSLDGHYLASAGEDCVIHIWQVMESEMKGHIYIDKLREGNANPLSTVNGSTEQALMAPNIENEKKKRGKASGYKKYMNSDHFVLPGNIFLLSEKPVCSFHGHLEDVLDLSWSKSQYLLSSSMDKTVRLWHMSSNSCLKVFSHNDYVTCIQFNPVDDSYFISGSLDAKVRIWSIPDRLVVDWSDLHEMVTAACYAPNGEAALVGSHKGSCRMYKTSGNKLQQERQIDVRNKKKKSQAKKITGLQFAPGNPSEVLVTSADSRIRVFDGADLIHKFKGFRNTSSQIAASFTANGKYVICASEDAHVYVWRHTVDSSGPATSRRSRSITRSYEHFHCRDVSVAVSWPGNQLTDQTACELNQCSAHESKERNGCTDSFQAGLCSMTKAASIPLMHASPSLPAAPRSGPLPSIQGNGQEGLMVGNCCEANLHSSPFPLHDLGSTGNFSSDRGAATWPEEKLEAYGKHEDNSFSSCRHCEAIDGKPVPVSGCTAGEAAWGLTIVTAGLGGEIRIFQNFGLPRRTQGHFL